MFSVRYTNILMKLTTLILNSVTTVENKALDIIRLGSVVAGAVSIGLTFTSSTTVLPSGSAPARALRWRPA